MEKDISKFSTVKIEQKKAKRYNYSFSVINSVKGKEGNFRIEINKALRKRIGNPSEIQISVSENCIAIAEKLPNAIESFAIKTGKSRDSIFSKPLTIFLTDYYNLNFENKSTITFSNIEFDTVILNDEEIYDIAYIYVEGGDTIDKQRD